MKLFNAIQLEKKKKKKSYPVGELHIYTNHASFIAKGFFFSLSIENAPGPQRFVHLLYIHTKFPVTFGYY